MNTRKRVRLDPDPAQLPATAKLLNVKDLAALLRVGRTKVWQLDKTGRLGPQKIKLGSCARWRRDEVVAWIDAGMPPRREWVELRKGA